MSSFRRHIARHVALTDITSEFTIRYAIYGVSTYGYLEGHGIGGVRSVRTRYYRNMKYVRYTAAPVLPGPNYSLLVYYDDSEKVISTVRDYTTLEDGSVLCRLKLPEGATSVAINGTTSTVPIIIGLRSK